MSEMECKHNIHFAMDCFLCETEHAEEFERITAERDALKAELDIQKTLVDSYYKCEQNRKSALNHYKRLAKMGREALESAVIGFDHIGGHLAGYGDKDMGIYGLKGFAFDRRNETHEALAAMSSMDSVSHMEGKELK